MQVLVTTTRAWYLDKTAKAFSQRHALAGLWMADKNASNLPPGEYRRCWPYHLFLKPFYHAAPQIWSERATYFFLHVYTFWLRAQLRSAHCPKLDVVHAIMGFGTEVFDYADEVGVLKVIDAPNSHPTTYYGYWQRECDLWCPGERVPIPRYMFARMNRELTRADIVIAQSKFCKESMVSNGIPAERIVVNLMGVDTSVFRKRETVPKKIRFVCVGTICLRKGHQYLFRAFQLAKQKLPDAELVCVGDYKCDFRRERPKWEGSFTHYPRLTHPEIAELLRSCTAFVFPSQEEGIARAQIEAMACGLPGIGTHEAGTTTLVEDGIEGFVVLGNDPAKLAERMIQLARDPELNQRMGEAAFRKGAVSNTWQDYGDRLLVEYQKRLDSKSALHK
jgi:glycosyltransferase involved in cell wall biosynthesis